MLHPPRNENRPQSVISELRTEYQHWYNSRFVHTSNHSLGYRYTLLLLRYLRLWHCLCNEINWTIEKDCWTVARRTQLILARERSYETTMVWMIIIWSFFIQLKKLMYLIVNSHRKWQLIFPYKIYTKLFNYWYK